MNVKLLNRDLALLLSVVGIQIRGVDWSTDDARDRWIIIWGGIRVPLFDPQRPSPSPRMNVFSRPDVNLKLPIPQDLYDAQPGQTSRVRFFTDVYVDTGLRIWDGARSGWREPMRYYPDFDPHTGAELQGWSYLCVIPSRHVNPNVNVLSVLAIVQRFLLTEA